MNKTKIIKISGKTYKVKSIVKEFDSLETLAEKRYSAFLEARRYGDLFEQYLIPREQKKAIYSYSSKITI